MGNTKGSGESDSDMESIEGEDEAGSHYSSEQEGSEMDDELETSMQFVDHSVPPHPFLRADVDMAAKTYTTTEREFGIPSVAIEESPSGEADCTVALAIAVGGVPERLLHWWDLDDCLCVYVLVEDVNKLRFRTLIDTIPHVAARKDTAKKSVFVVGEALSNLTRKMLEAEFRRDESAHPSEIGSFFSKLYERLVKRLQNISEYCLLCGDELYAGGINISICERPLCAFQYQTLGICDGLTIPRVSSDVLSLLMIVMSEANQSNNRDLFFRPQPPIKSEEDFRKEGVRLAEFYDDKKITYTNLKTPFAMLQVMKDYAPCPKAILSSATAYREFRAEWPRTAELLEWLVISNRSYLERVPPAMEVSFLKTTLQYLFVADTPSKQAEFDELVKTNGGKTRFFFHGSRSHNWHSIIRTGLKNMSNTPMMTTGAAYGPGIYLSPDLATSWSYSHMPAKPTRRTCTLNQCCLHNGKNPTYNIVALVEVVDSSDAYREGHASIYIANHEKYCSIRMLLLYSGENDVYARVNTVRLKDLGKGDREQITKVVNLFKNMDVNERANHV